jgi:hypothetical protein
LKLAELERKLSQSEATARRAAEASAREIAEASEQGKLSLKMAMMQVTCPVIPASFAPLVFLRAKGAHDAGTFFVGVLWLFDGQDPFECGWSHFPPTFLSVESKWVNP